MELFHFTLLITGDFSGPTLHDEKSSGKKTSLAGSDFSGRAWKYCSHHGWEWLVLRTKRHVLRRLFLTQPMANLTKLFGDDEYLVRINFYFWIPNGWVSCGFLFLILCVHLYLGEDYLVDQHVFHLRFYQLLLNQKELEKSALEVLFECVHRVLGGSSQDLDKWLITMVSFRPLTGVVGPLPNGLHPGNLT